MSEEATVDQLRTKLHNLEKHVIEQDTEIYRLSKRVDSLVNALQVQKLQIEALAQNGASGADTMPADEKPPHY
ncbi:MAG: SlyX family protein [Opitutaceae bacterium]